MLWKKKLKSSYRSGSSDPLRYIFDCNIFLGLLIGLLTKQEKVDEREDSHGIESGILDRYCRLLQLVCHEHVSQVAFSDSHLLVKIEQIQFAFCCRQLHRDEPSLVHTRIRFLENFLPPSQVILLLRVQWPQGRGRKHYLHIFGIHKTERASIDHQTFKRLLSLSNFHRDFGDDEVLVLACLSHMIIRFRDDDLLT